MVTVNGHLVNNIANDVAADLEEGVPVVAEPDVGALVARQTSALGAAGGCASNARPRISSHVCRFS
jgi:hypothetical protein